jgi:hypothetical protein
LFVNASTRPNEHQMYVAGTPTLATDDGCDWACDYIWQPEARYLRLPGLAAIPTTDWQGALVHAVSVLTPVGPWESSAGVAGVGVGFDGGDVIVIWSRT